jgi:hypothetical protein
LPEALVSSLSVLSIRFSCTVISVVPPIKGKKIVQAYRVIILLTLLNSNFENNSRVAEQRSDSRVAEQRSNSLVAQQRSDSQVAEQHSNSRVAEQRNHLRIAEQRSNTRMCS